MSEAERTTYATVVAGPDQVIVLSREAGAEDYVAELYDSDGNLAVTLGRFRDRTTAYAFVPVMMEVASLERRALWASFDDEARREMRDNDLGNLHAAGAVVRGGCR